MAGADGHGRRTPAHRERHLKPAPAGADIWYARDAWFDRVRDGYRALLSPDERTRHARFMFARDRDQFLATRGMLRVLLGAYTGLPPAECPIETDRHGRPRLASWPSIDFNLSHTRGMIVVAITAGRTVGVDVECTTRGWPAELPARYFAPAEAAALDREPPETRHQRFYEIWTLKEAYVKARGLGLAIPLTSFAMHVESEGRASVTFDAGFDDRSDRWQLQIARIESDYCLAVALAREERDRPIVTRAFQPDATEVS